MYRLLIVDDEPEVTEGLQDAINWTQYGVTEVMTAVNGKEAMECFERIEPDIVVTDISMPYMNGLQLTEWIKTHYPLTKVMIISGYDDFQYAKQAIHLQVEEYLLKPFSNEQLLESIIKVIESITKEREERLNIRALEEHYRTSLPLLREKFLVSLITRKHPLSLIEQRAKKYNMELDGKGYLISLISIYHSDQYDDHSPSLVDSHDYDLKLFAVSNVATELWQSEGLGKVFIHQDEVVLITAHPQDDKQAVMFQTVICLRHILQSIQKYLRMSAIISVGTYVTNVDQLKYSYDSAVSGLDYRRIMDHNSIICIEDIENTQQSTLYFDEMKEQHLIRTLKLGNEEELEAVIHHLFEEIEQAQITVSDYEQYFLEMLTSIQKLIKSLDSTHFDVKGLGEYSRLLLQYQEQKSLEETKQWLKDICTNVQQSIARTRQFASQKLVEEAIAYTKENYIQNDLAIATLCQYLHISPGYFSGVFKKAIGLTYGNFVQKIRMEKAQELLRTTDLKAFEIAEMVGFTDPNYFSLSFKKYTGISAKDYRNGLMRKG